MQRERLKLYHEVSHASNCARILNIILSTFGNHCMILNHSSMAALEKHSGKISSIEIWKMGWKQAKEKVEKGIRRT